MLKFFNNEPYDYIVDFTFDEKTNVMRKPELKTTLHHNGKAQLSVCLGKKETVNTRVVMRAIATAINTIKKIGGKSALAKTDEIENLLDEEGLRALMLGALLALDEPINFKSNAPKETKGFSLFLDKQNNILDEVVVLADHIKLARKLVNMPGNKLTPQVMSEEMQTHAKELGLDVTIFDDVQIQEMKMGALWAVGKGSINLPRLVVIRYMGNPQKADDITAVIGKGVTFDTGGYNLKPGPSMVNMKGDMGGAAATFATICALAKNKVKANVVAVLPLAENCIAGSSFKADDVIHSMSGKTIEVLNTDAEGRLIMCDALTYAIQKENAKRVINIATLTGAMVAVLGYYTAGVLSNDEEFLDEFLQSSKKTSEQYWQLPRYDEYYTMLETPIADIKNVADGCGAIVAGLFMEFFAEDLPWIHIDIAGPAFLPTPKYEFYKKGGTGAGVEALYRLFVDLENK